MVSVDVKHHVYLLAPKHAREHETHPLTQGKKKKFRLDWNGLGFIWAGVSNMVS